MGPFLDVAVGKLAKGRKTGWQAKNFQSLHFDLFDLFEELVVLGALIRPLQQAESFARAQDLV